MGKTYKQLSLEERCRIARLYGEKQSIRQIATIMDRPASTISREIGRNGSAQNKYLPVQADDKAWARRWCGSKLERQPCLRKYVLDRLVMGWSPQQISGRMAREKHSMGISHESIYCFIYAQLARTKNAAWRRYLPRAKFKRGFHGKKGGASTQHIKRRVGIAQRPNTVDARKEVGHWEADLLMFSDKKHNVLVSQERVSRYIFMAGQCDKTAQRVVNRQKAWFEKLPPEMRRTLMQDNGTEFALHYQLTDELDMKTYFCNSRSPWQKGRVENMNGRLRHYLPRNTKLEGLLQENINLIALKLNTTPRKCLDYKTPLEVFSNQLLHFKLELTSPFSRE